MSTHRNQLEQLKNELERESEHGSTTVRIRKDVHKMATEEAKKQNKSIVTYITLAVIEKLLREC